MDEGDMDPTLADNHRRHNTPLLKRRSVALIALFISIFVAMAGYDFFVQAELSADLYRLVGESLVNTGSALYMFGNLPIRQHLRQMINP